MDGKKSMDKNIEQGCIRDKTHKNVEWPIFRPPPPRFNSPFRNLLLLVKWHSLKAQKINSVRHLAKEVNSGKIAPTNQSKKPNVN